MGSFSETCNDPDGRFSPYKSVLTFRAERSDNHQYACSRCLVAGKLTRVSQHVHFWAWQL